MFCPEDPKNVRISHHLFWEPTTLRGTSVLPERQLHLALILSNFSGHLMLGVAGWALWFLVLTKASSVFGKPGPASVPHGHGAPSCDLSCCSVLLRAPYLSGPSMSASGLQAFLEWTKPVKPCSK